LPHAAGGLRDAVEPLSDHVRPLACVADPRRADGDRRNHAPLLQPAAPRPQRLAGARSRGRGHRRARVTDQAVIAFLLVAIVVVVSPGPDFALTVRNTVVRDRRGGLQTATGVVAGQLVWEAATVAGLAALLIASRPAFFRAAARRRRLPRVVGSRSAPGGVAWCAGPRAPRARHVAVRAGAREQPRQSED